MRTTENRFPIFIALLAAIFFCSIPESANAQATPFSAQNCFSQMQNSYLRAAQDKTIANNKIFVNSPLASMKAVYCWSTVLVPLWTALGALTSAANGLNVLGAIIWGIVQSILFTVITSLINEICQVVTSAINAAKSWIMNLICLPLPHFNLNFNMGSFQQKSCGPGTVSLIGLLANLGATRRTTPAAWGMWGLTQQY